MKRIIFILGCLIVNLHLVADDDAYGVREVYTNLARTTMRNVITHLEAAIDVVEQDIYPNLRTYTRNVKNVSTTIYAYLVNTSGNTSTFSHWITTRTDTNSSTYTKNPYISKLAIVDYGLKIQMQFVSTSVNSIGGFTSAKVPIHEAFLGRRIMLIPVFNIVYSIGTLISSKDSAISAWTCLTDVDETIASASNGISEGTLSIVAVAGGALGSCQYITSATMNTIWITI